MNLQKMSFDERPRERLSLYGVKSLSNAELIAILIRSGSKQKNAIDLGRAILQKHKLRDLNTMSHQELEKTRGIGFSKACTIIAAAELGKRAQQYNPAIGEKIVGPKSAYRIVSAELQHEKQEKFVGIFLNSRDKLIQKKTLFIGTIDKQLISAREVIKAALDSGASKVIVAHNHPSGDLQPSETDKTTTQHLKEALALSQIELVDHLIVCNNRYFSFSRERIL